MVIAALIAFGLLLIAWILAPTDGFAPLALTDAPEPVELAALPEAAPAA